ncbi:DUF5642 family protein [Mycobacterium sp. URHB0044]|uniref:DUF5642 family protein n=1 Tax=Mycobacterium sp. URHB0044 TaxID=1380386 RepID=UPI00048D30E9|nr:DUF5642 family protein [Mycobacterium sp. URHB0044]
MRVFAAFVAVAVALCAACGPSDVPRPTAGSPRPAAVDLAHVARVRGDLPSGYEVADLVGPTAPSAFWGFGPQWTADPPQCGVLADPAVDGATARGWSASGPGGIVYVVAAAGPATGPDVALIGDCGSSTFSAGRTSATVTTVEAPSIDAATTLGTRTETTTVVEGGTETHSHADTFTAYFGGYVAYVTVVTDPGSSGPILGADFAAGLLVKTVSALQG